MKKIILIGLIVIIIMMSSFGCAAEKGFIVRNDITEDDLNIFYVGITQDQIMQAFGLPYLYRSNERTTLYHYNLSNGYIEVYFRQGIYAGNKVIDYGETYQENPYMEDSFDNIGKIESGKYIMSIRRDIPKDELRFISSNISCNELQNKLGAPYDFKPYSEGDGDNLIETNAFLYDLEETDILNIIYSKSGNVMGAWIEDKDGQINKTIVEVKI